MRQRLVLPEILDSLPHDAPAAIRSRRDLRRVNWLMGNYRWVWDRMQRSSCDSWFELGAGEGRSAMSCQTGVHDVDVTGIDLAPRPLGWPDSWRWIQRDLFEALTETGNSEGRGCIVVLFLHHLGADDLLRLGRILNDGCPHLIVAEPARWWIFRILAYLLFPIVNRVTRHDMQVSIGAGFRKGELQQALGLSDEWSIEESVHWLGGYRFEARRLAA